MNRRDFLRASATLAAGAIAAPQFAQSEAKSARFCDMHAHVGSRTLSYRESMGNGDMLLVADKVTPDTPIVRLGRLAVAPDGAAIAHRRYLDAAGAA